MKAPELMKAKVEVFLKPGVLDVEGKAIEGALHGLGFPTVAQVRVGKTIVFDVAGETPAAAETEVRAMCERLLANTVIEGYRVAVTDMSVTDGAVADGEIQGA
jgi:phosphoribosylformylglycinamidine synthase